jgi:glycosyltransferase involved in cell wall biosynthesis
MKVLQVINSLATGGAEKLLLDSIPKYSEKGIQMDLLLLNGNEHPFYLNFKKSKNAKLFELGKSSVYNPLHIFKIRNYFKHYDSIHVHLFPALYWVAIAKMISFSKVKLIYTEHSTGNRRNNSFFFKIIDRIIYAKYDKIICITSEVEDYLIHKLKETKAKFEVIENGVDLSKIKEAKAYNITDLNLSLPNEVKLIIQVSSFQHPKDQMTVIKSLQNLPKNVHLLLAGQGPLMEQCKQLTDELKLTNRVHFLGVRMDVLNLLKTADIIVLSSGFEGLSLSCIEGLASGKPFLASDVKGLREIVTDSDVLFPFQDDKELARMINELLNNKEKYNQIATKGLEKAKQYDSAIMIEKHIKLYHSMQ